MTTQFPTALDTLTNPSPSSNMSDAGVLHSDQHANANDAIEALQAKVGIDSSADTNSLDYKLRQKVDLTALTELVQDIVGAFLAAGANISLNYNDAANTLTITGTGGGGGGGLGDGDYGDFTVSGGVATIDVATITLAKMANLATGNLIGRLTAGTGAPEAVPMTSLPVSTAQQSAIDAKVANDMTTSSTVAPSKSAVLGALAAYALLASPALTGTPTVPTASPGTNTTQAASTAFVAAAVSAAVSGLLNLKTSLDCSTNPNYPSAAKGDAYFVSVAGKVGGASGKSVDVSDMIIATSANAGGTEASVGTSWIVLEHNLVGALLSANNLSDLQSVSTALTNLGFSAFIKTLIDDADAATARGTLGAAPTANPSFTGNETHAGIDIFTPYTISLTSNAGTIDTTKTFGQASNGVNTTLSFSATPSDGAWCGAELSNSDGSNARTWTIPSCYSQARGTTISSVVVPAGGKVQLWFTWVGGSPRVFGDPPAANNLSASTAPAVTDDGTKGYGAGSVWINTTAHRLWIAESVGTGAAVWKELGTAGRHAIPVSAGAMRPSATGGCANLANIASAANQPDLMTLDFDPTTQEYAQFAVAMPKSWNEGTITAKFIWSHAATATSFGAVWSLQAVAVSDGDTIASNYGTAVQVTDTGGTTNTQYVSPETAAITVAGTPQAEDIVYFRVARVAADAADTMTIDARLHGLVLFINTDAESDA